MTAKRAPEPRHGVEWVVTGAGRPGEYWCSAAGTVLHPPSGPGRFPCRDPPWCRTSQIAASGPIRRELMLFY